MDRIAYVVLDAGNAPVYASFDETLANANAEAGHRVEPQVVDPTARIRSIGRKCDALDLLCMENASTAVDTIVYLSETAPGGVDGRDFRDKGGLIRFASFRKDEIERHIDSWTKLRSIVVKPSQVALEARGKLDPIDLMCLDDARIGPSGNPGPRGR